MLHKVIKSFADTFLPLPSVNIESLPHNILKPRSISCFDQVLLPSQVDS